LSLHRASSDFRGGARGSLPPGSFSAPWAASVLRPLGGVRRLFLSWPLPTRACLGFIQKGNSPCCTPRCTPRSVQRSPSRPAPPHSTSPPRMNQRPYTSRHKQPMPGSSAESLHTRHTKPCNNGTQKHTFARRSDSVSLEASTSHITFNSSPASCSLERTVARVSGPVNLKLYIVASQIPGPKRSDATHVLSPNVALWVHLAFTSNKLNRHNIMNKYITRPTSFLSLVVASQSWRCVPQRFGTQRRIAPSFS